MLNLKFVLLSLGLIFCLLVQISSAQNSTSIPFPQSVIRHMATRQMRYHHYLWHQIRDNWGRFNEQTKTAFRRLGWEPPNPTEDNNGNKIRNNFAGEDFLYMHRQMIATANQIITQNRERYGQIRGWTTIPAPGDREFPVPAAYQRGSSANSGATYKTQDHYDRMKRRETDLKNPTRLRRMTLNELGLELESGIHNSMHNRWAGPSSVGYRGGGNINGASVPYIDKRYDDVRYDWLVDTYSSHVNPIFWKLHGWIDDRVEDWRRANGLTSIRWSGTWVGGPMANLGSALRKEGQMDGMDMNDDPEYVSDVLEETLKVFLDSGIPESSPEGKGLPNTRHCRAKPTL